MKAIGFITVIAVGLGVFGWSSGWFNPTVEANVSPKVTEKVETLTQDAIDSAQESTNKAFDSLKKKLQEGDE